jgi:hypothetical protein
MSRCTVDDWASRLPDRKQDQVRLMLEGPYPPVPPDLAFRARERGRRLLRRRHVLHVITVSALLAALIILLVVAGTTLPVEPAGPPADPPPLDW